MTLFLAILIGAAPSVPQGHWEGYAEHEGRRWAVFLRLSEGPDGGEATVDFPDLGIYGHELHRANSSGDGVEFTCALQGRMLRLNGKILADGITGRIEVFGTSTKLHLDPSAKEPEVLIMQDISCANGDVELAGTLILPGTGDRGPAIILTHGSGAQGRTTTFYRSRAIFFARHGIASLIYDKRGTGRSTGDWKTATLADLAGDAVCWVEFLKAQADVDPKRIGIEGSSQGGWIAPMAATRSPDIAFVVVGSTPGISPAEQNTFSVRSALAANSVDGETVEEICAVRERLDRYYATGEGREELVAALSSVYARHESASWFKDAWLPPLPLGPGGPGTINHYTKDDMLLDPGQFWRRVTVPVLAMWGENDRDVPARPSMDVLTNALAQAENFRTTFHIFPEAGHGFRLNPPAGAWDFPRLSPEYSRVLTEWLRDNVLATHTQIR